MRKSSFARVASVCAAALALTLAGATAASAEPNPLPTPGTPASYRTYAAVGSDTIQDVWNGLSNGSGAVAPSVASWNAFPSTLSSTIQTKDGGAIFLRPRGSGAGVKALSASVHTPFLYDNGAGSTVNVQGQVDFARSSSGPAATTVTNQLKYIPFARDAVSVAYRAASAAAATPTFTKAQLNAIFSCTSSADGVIGVSGGFPTIAASGQVLKPQLPQTSSGTRSFFISAIGLTTVGGCVVSGAAENDGTVLTATGDIIPFSAAQWIAQKNTSTTGVTNTVSNAALKIANFNNGTTTKTAVVVTSGVAGPGTLYGSATAVPNASTDPLARDTYNVVDASVIGTGTATGLEKVLTTDLSTTAAKATISKFGFLNLSYLGDRTLYRNGAYTN
ncbi:hypothetical protein ACEXQB_003045 [Herbiconiux sp. P18]|uniref:hypothetical protein n=1 Tax=Herbiconiux liangxiaofengii TaxID=3342795 RepID=UPI003CEA0439